MKNLLQIVNNNLNIAPEALMIKEFKDIWKRDKSKSKTRALKELAYVYHSTDYQSIYRNYHPEHRESKIRLDIMEDKDWTPDTVIILAQAKYRELQRTLSMEILDDVELGLIKLREYFRDVDFDEDENGVAAKNFIANVKAMGDLVKGVKSLKEEIEKELTDQMQLRGGSTIGRREVPPEKRG
jgi:hypothetical protein